MDAITELRLMAKSFAVLSDAHHWNWKQSSPAVSGRIKHFFMAKAYGIASEIVAGRAVELERGFTDATDVADLRACNPLFADEEPRPWNASLAALDPHAADERGDALLGRE